MVKALLEPYENQILGSNKLDPRTAMEGFQITFLSIIIITTELEEKNS